LKEFVSDQIRDCTLEQLEVPVNWYFTEPQYARYELFSCYSVYPFTNNELISYLSPWVESEVEAAAPLRDCKRAEELAKTGKLMSKFFKS
jgi:hypothetical protein